jgi:Holliday junction resolvase RusA-like endonuclease
MDTCKGIVYKDDALIYKLTTSKLYSDRPRTEIIIYW